MSQTEILYRNDPGTDDDYARQQCRLDLSVPSRPARGYPLLVWFHGGALTGGSRHEADAVSARFAGEGIGVANADYRLAPQVRFPVYIEDAAAVVAWAVTEGVRRGADPEAIFVGGHSAGAYIATMLAMDERYLQSANVPDGSVAGYIPISGQFVTHSQVRAERGISRETMIVDDAAPLYYVRKNAPPILLLVGDQDIPARLEEAALFAAAMNGIAENDTTSFLVLPGRDHSTVHDNLLTPGDIGGPAMLAFIRRHSR
jgi:acetyl esterase/lipase